MTEQLVAIVTTYTLATATMAVALWFAASDLDDLLRLMAVHVVGNVVGVAFTVWGLVLLASDEAEETEESAP